MSETLTQTLRERLGKMMRPEWPAKRITLRAVAKASGTSAATVLRFLEGNSVDSDTLDRIAAFLESERAGVYKP